MATMPIYEFYSPDTHRIYSFYARSLAQGRLTPRCPDNPQARMERLVSRFAVTGRTKEKPEAPDGGMPDPRIEQMMAEMESEISSMNEDNPDPRQLGRLMRKMSEATGEKMPDSMEQMIRRLEKGEDPEKLEEEYGEAFEKMEEAFGQGEAASDGTPRRRRRQPARDPRLHEMSDFV